MADDPFETTFHAADVGQIAHEEIVCENSFGENPDASLEISASGTAFFPGISVDQVDANEIFTVLQQAHALVLQQQTELDDLRNQLNFAQEETKMWRSNASKTLLLLDQERSKVRKLSKMLKEEINELEESDVSVELQEKSLNKSVQRETSSADAYEKYLSILNATGWFSDISKSMDASGFRETRTLPSMAGKINLPFNKLPQTDFTTGDANDMNPPQEEQNYNPFFDATEALTFQILPDHLLKGESTTHIVGPGRRR